MRKNVTAFRHITSHGMRLHRTPLVRQLTKREDLSLILVKGLVPQARRSAPQSHRHRVSLYRAQKGGSADVHKFATLWRCKSVTAASGAPQNQACILIAGAQVYETAAGRFAPPSTGTPGASGSALLQNAPPARRRR